MFRYLLLTQLKTRFRKLPVQNFCIYSGVEALVGIYFTHLMNEQVL